MLRYAITSRALYPGDEQEKQAALLRQTSHWAADGIDFIQLREKDLSAAAIATLARDILKTIALTASSTRLLINSRADIAIATGARGVHLTSDPCEVTPKEIRGLYASARLHAPIVTVSCHTIEEVQRAREDQADAILFAPVFEKRLSGNGTIAGQGLDRLHAACTAASLVPVYALGGVTLENAGACIAAGAAGIAGIRLFHNSQSKSPEGV
jgi:thiamine-phosphate pyrophosphorylase